MARSARELFEEAMRLDPEERATLMRLLIESLDTDSEEGVEDAWRVEIERRMAELDSGRCRRSRGTSLERGCTGAECRQLPSSCTPPRPRRWKRRMTRYVAEILTPPTAFAKSYCTRLMLWVKVRGPGPPWPPGPTVCLPAIPLQSCYVLRHDEVEVVAVAHAKRRPGYWRSRL